MASISLTVDIDGLSNDELDLMEDKVSALLKGGGIKADVIETDREEDDEDEESDD
jgi:hypothetical protein